MSASEISRIDVVSREICHRRWLVRHVAAGRVLRHLQMRGKGREHAAVAGRQRGRAQVFFCLRAGLAQLPQVADLRARLAVLGRHDPLALRVDDAGAVLAQRGLGPAIAEHADALECRRRDLLAGDEVVQAPGIALGGGVQEAHQARRPLRLRRNRAVHTACRRDPRCARRPGHRPARSRGGTGRCAAAAAGPWACRARRAIACRPRCGRQSACRSRPACRRPRRRRTRLRIRPARPPIPRTGRSRCCRRPAPGRRAPPRIGSGPVSAGPAARPVRHGARRAWAARSARPAPRRPAPACHRD